LYRKISKCRICGNDNLEKILDLGMLMLTGLFPRDKKESVTTGPLCLVKCTGSDEVCGLLQLEHSYDLDEMYGKNYGYRSGLNVSMVDHLGNKVKKILDKIELSEGDLVIDIGSNDSTTLQAYPSSGATLVGVDPSGIKFNKYYPPYIQLIPDFFSSSLVNKYFPGRKAKIITSFSMFYDLEDPVSFMQQVYDSLADEGIWVFEQSYMPTMLETNSFDTVCHEHLEFYALRQIKWMTSKIGFKIVDIEFNNINGGSFSVTVIKSNKELEISSKIQKILDKERIKGLDTLVPYQEFAKRVAQVKNDLLTFISDSQAAGKTIAALGASTKGNVLLQYCGLTIKEIKYVGEINSDKFGCYTPGTWIPIISEEELLSKEIDYLLVLPWHFKEFFMKSQKFKEIKLIFPLPGIEIN
jgi:hypothetical protein